MRGWWTIPWENACWSLRKELPCVSETALNRVFLIVHLNGIVFGVGLMSWLKLLLFLPLNFRCPTPKKLKMCCGIGYELQVQKSFREGFYSALSWLKCLNFWPTSASQITMRGWDRYKSTSSLVIQTFRMYNSITSRCKELVETRKGWFYLLVPYTYWWWSCTFETSG